jgi:hypothetical protein
MKVVRCTITVFAFVLIAIAAAACGGSASVSPVAPSSSSAGASISGTVSGSAIAAPLTGLELNDNVQLSVTDHGSGAHGDAKDHSTPAGNRREFQGRISSIDANGTSFQIPGLTVKTTATTVIRHGNKTMQFADLKVGDHIQARGTKDGTTLTATEVKVESEADDQGDDDDHDGTELSGVVSDSSGTCPTVTFTVQSTKVTVNNDTAYPHTSCADATKNSAKVEVKGAKQTDGSVLATSVSLDD